MLHDRQHSIFQNMGQNSWYARCSAALCKNDSVWQRCKFADIFSTSCSLEGFRVEISYVCENAVSSSTRYTDGEDPNTRATVIPSESETIANERDFLTISKRQSNSREVQTSEKFTTPRAQMKTTSKFFIIQEAKVQTSKSTKLESKPTTTLTKSGPVATSRKTFTPDHSIPTTPPLNPLSQQTTEYESVTVSRSLDNNECVRAGDYSALDFCLDFVSGDDSSRTCYQVYKFVNFCFI